MNKMESFFEHYMNCRGVKPLFSEVTVFDWYDGAVYGIGIINDWEKYLFNLVAWDVELNIRIFSILELSEEWSERFNKADNSDTLLLIGYEFYGQYNSDVFVLKSKGIEEINYTMIEIKENKLIPPDSIESIANQNNEDKNRWFNLFS